MARMTRAFLLFGDEELLFPVNPYTGQWSYQENTQSFDTIGGRVVQLLSVQVQDLTITSVAGSRAELQRMADGIKRVMEWHVATEMPATFRVPSRGWDFKVYVKSMPQIGWDVTATAYPYQLLMAIDEDVSGIKEKQLEQAALQRLSQNIGYQKDFHGGNAGNFQKLVTTVLANSTPVSGGGSTRGGFGPGDVSTVDVSGLNGSQTTVEQWGAAVLKAGGWPVCKNNLIYFVAWGIKENGCGKYNVLGTTVGGSVTHDFASASQGIATVVSFLNNGNYDKVVRDLKQCANFQVTGQDITNSPWCYQCGDYIMPILAQVSKSYDSYRNQTLHAFTGGC